jgi:hypothetical protein
MNKRPSTFTQNKVVKTRSGLLVGLVMMACALAGATRVSAAPALSASPVSALRESVASAPITITGAAGIVAVQFDLVYDAGFISAGTVTPGTSLHGHLVVPNKLSPDRLRIIIYSPQNTSLTDGVAANVALTIATLAPLGPTTLRLEGVIFSNASAQSIAGTFSNGTLTIAPAFPPRLDTLTRAQSGNVSFLLTGSSGQSYILQNSSDLLNWNPFSTNFLSGASILINDSTLGVPRRFYRALEGN